MNTRPTTKPRFTRRATLAAVAAAHVGLVALAADTTYTGPAAGTWNVAANWNNGVPTAGNNTFVDNGAAGNVNVTVTATATTGTLSISGGDQVTIANNVFLNLNGNGTTSLLNNAGIVAINAGANSTRLRFANADITGGGTIALSGANAVLDGTAGVRVVNLDNFIHGEGNIGAELITFDNHATIAADVNGGTLTLDPDGNSGTFSFMRNLGVLRATNGGILALSGNNGGTFNNAGGTIEAQDGSAVHVVTFGSVFDGTIVTSGTGSVRVGAGQNGFFSSVTNTGLMVGENNSDFGVSTGLINNGTISLEPTTHATDFEIQNDVTLSGTGQLIMNGPLAGINGADDRRLTNAAGHTIRGQGSLGQVGIWWTNQGTILADVPGGTLTLTGDGTAGATAMINTGTLRATNGGILVISGAEGDITGTGGLIESQDGSAVYFVTNIDVRGGTLTASGTGSLRVGTGQNAFFENVFINGNFVSENNSDWGASVAITNNGTITLDAGANATDFEIQNDVLLSGTGHLVMSGANAGINGVDDRRLTNAAGHTIRGQGSIGQVGIWLANQGTIAADVAGATLTLSADGTAGQNAFINTGRLIATNGGILSLSGLEGGFTGTGGTIEAQNDSVVRFVSNASVLGGTFVSTGTGTFRVTTGNTVILNDITLNGTLVAENNTDIDTFGPIVNNGTILIDSTLNATDLDVRQPTLLDGTGQLVLSGAFATVSGLNDRRLTNGTSHTIRGQGLVGGTEIWVTNNGTILADVSGGSITLAADGSAGANAFISDGTIRATNAATVQFGPSEGGFSGLGSVVADANSNIHSVSGAAVNQGPVSGEGGFSALSGSNFTATHYRVGSVTVNAATARIRAGGGTLGTSKVNSLTLVGAARLDMTDHDLIIDYTGASPFATIRPQIATAYGTGNWAGVGITSSAAAAAASTPDGSGLGYVEATDIFTSFPATFRGQSVDATSILIGYTLLGDANLDRIVNIGDFSRLAANFNLPSTWFNGDFNYDGTTGIADFSLLAANFNKALPADLPRGAAVPEASSLAPLGLAASLKLRRRRHRDSNMVGAAT